ncbi:tRNA (adenosine(37)-N6)-threonylcarbamoyltransferase complex transferase subunit TsaD [Croceimicrobium hydrocarbonivorans]|uniref:tRNA N6-adenosine threonylcarbamoyltransferase n=1 Tax=Croceimicrobium hydrocarbonivorans TaxID=2761580 RepID=A0A7H0VDJ5_9FLAO|nr:tRNA (adenosine(37)-N6)-threonylcarbamoyltransferase complex transferase subunit TsaD [Croceimicrobium hydrocarbonivorans]QNR23793.1 tRNA (adenosine(37)-N6)-threonylcarbamoyltransferase complex transferase subunit TsaD [Croceimicrobium hydrocarbonivorans]
MDITILGIESSCDDTSIAIVQNRKILANVTANQKIHAEYGGVVPELASRAHQQNIVPTLDAALKKAGITLNELSAVAFTSGPGLLGSLLVGTSFAKSLSLALDIPLIEVNHMQAHILAHLIEDPRQANPEFPFLCLTVSGGHTQIVQVNSPYDMKLLGSTIDDAAGEAFDKAGKIMGLPYPAGPEIDRRAKLGNPGAFEFAKPRMPELQFSFSGLKTSILYFLQKQMKENPDFIKENLNDLCASIQNSIVGILMDKLELASQQYGINRIAIAGGVSANSGLRDALEERKSSLNWELFLPSFEYTTDNGAMIAISGYYQYQKQNFADLSVVAAARKPLEA